MALCPFAEVKLLPESSTQPRITPRVAILHSAAGRGSLFRFFRDSSSLESHFWIDVDGRIEQYVDTGRRADANRDANGFAVSIETSSSPAATEPWTPAQVAAILRLLRWLATVHPIPLRKCDRWDGSGIGHHTMWGAPSRWTPVAKSCPGPARKAQFPGILAALATGHEPAPPTPTPTPQPEGALMVTAEDERKIRAIVADEMAKALGPVTMLAENLVSDLIPSDTKEKGKFAPRVLAALTRLEAKK